MTIRNRNGGENRSKRNAGNRRGGRIAAMAGLALVVVAVTVAALTGSPEPAHACLLPGIPC